MAYIIQNRIKYGGSVPQVAVQDTAPTNPNIEVWYDTSEDAVAEAKDIKYDNSISGSDKITVQAELDKLNTGDRIVERGVKDTWTYEKWNSGKLIAIMQSLANNLTATNGLYVQETIIPTSVYDLFTLTPIIKSFQYTTVNSLWSIYSFVAGLDTTNKSLHSGFARVGSTGTAIIDNVQTCIELVGKWK